MFIQLKPLGTTRPVEGDFITSILTVNESIMLKKLDFLF